MFRNLKYNGEGSYSEESCLLQESMRMVGKQRVGSFRKKILYHGVKSIRIEFHFPTI